MYAVIRDGGRQFTVRQGDRVMLDRRPEAKEGADLTFTDVLLVGGTGGTRVGTPTVAGARVLAKVLGEAKADKLVVFKKRRRKHSRCKHGHREKHTAVRIEKIEA